MHLLTPRYWEDYELIDCGDYEKLERFGDLVLIRSEPSAFWAKNLSDKEWENLQDLRFISETTTKGRWKKKSSATPDQWQIQYKSPAVHIQFNLKTTAFKHVGIFPEQAVNWEYIARTLRSFQQAKPKVLNLFAYTGGASLVAQACGADTTHVDSIRQVVTWANQNQQLSGLKDIRWVVEDAWKFVKREIKRGNRYQGIMLDPPAFGHGPKGERWKLEDHLKELIPDVVQLLDPQEHFLILNTYSDGLKPKDLQELLQLASPLTKNIETAELYLESNFNKKLMLGAVGRFKKIKTRTK